MTDLLDDAWEAAIIPYQELLGNYDLSGTVVTEITIIPYQELLGNYDTKEIDIDDIYHYTIPRAIREL